MQLNQVMTREVEVMRPGSTIREAAQRMKDLDVGMFPVCDGERLVGAITDRDIAIRATADGRDAETTVDEVMTKQIDYCFEDQETEEAVDLMNANQIRRLPILNRDKRLVGIVSLGDLATRAEDPILSAEALQGISEPCKPAR
jgi:CBS domain-containing protein